MTASTEPSADDIRRLVVSVALAQDDELDHAAIGELLDAFADHPERPMPPALAVHLPQCPECRAVLDALVETAMLERRGALPSADALLARLAPPAGAARAASTASATAVPTARPVAVPRVDRPGPFPAPRRWAVPALAAMAAMLALGWAGSLRQAHDLAAQLDLARQQIDAASTAGGGLTAASMETMLRAANTMRFARADDGSWGRVVFNPDATRAMMWAGDLPALPDGAHVSCWLLRDGAEAELVWDADHLDGGDQEWWLIDADRSLSSYDSVAITLEPAGTVVVEVPLQGS